MDGAIGSGNFFVRDHIPLKEGLRRGHFLDEVADEYRVRDHIPLKEGLRQLITNSLKPTLVSETIFH